MQGDFRIGAVIGRTVAILGGNMRLFLAIAGVCNLLPQIVTIFAAVFLAGVTPHAPGRSPAPGLVLSSVLGTVAVALAVAAVGLIGKGATIEATLALSEGRRVSFASALAVGVRSFPSNLVILILDYVAVGFASFLLVVPGIMLLCRWIVAIPVNVAERRDIFGALRRSRDLTDGSRWPIFGMLLIFGLLSAVVPVATLLTGSNHAAAGASSGPTAFLAAIVTLIGNVGLAAIYIELRAKNGSLPSGLVAAFE